MSTAKLNYFPAGDESGQKADHRWGWYRQIRSPSPFIPLPIGWGEGDLHGARFTPGGARSSLGRGYYHVIPTGFQFGSLRSKKTNDGAQALRVLSYQYGTAT